MKNGWHLHQLNVNNAFLYGDLDEEIYMKPPPGLTLSDPTKVCRLKKSLYGLKQASRQWYAKLSSALKTMGYQHSRNDYSLFLKHMGDSIVFVAMYVDYVIITGNHEQEITSLMEFLEHEFKIKDLGYLNYFLGLEILHEPNGVVLTQQKFTHDLLTEFGCDSGPSSLCPLEENIKLHPHKGAPLLDPLLYRKLVGKLNFQTNTRPVQYLSQFMQDPRTSHMDAAMHCLKYLKQNPCQGLFLKNSTDSHSKPIVTPTGQLVLKQGGQ